MDKNFSIKYQDKKSAARVGVIYTEHGELQTPAFMTVGTKATVKGLTTQQLKEIGVPVVLCNTYHLFLNPGGEIISKFGGLHKFMNWDGPIFTDSGGFQIFSMGHGTVSDEIKGVKGRIEKPSLLEITEQGARFKSYRDGSEKILTPELSIEQQYNLGADMIVVLDECTPFHIKKLDTEKSMNMTHRWLERCTVKHRQLNSRQILYGVIQGGVYPEFREKSANFVAASDCKGICVGGSLGKTREQMHEIVSTTMSFIRSTDKPVHLLGIGNLESIIHGVAQGIDTFDCVSPTRDARHGKVYSSVEKNFTLNIKNSRCKFDSSPIDKNCNCYVCRNFSRGYIRYLLSAGEMLGMNLCSYHNVAFMKNFMDCIRHSILSDNFAKFREKFADGEIVDFPA